MDLVGGFQFKVCCLGLVSVFALSGCSDDMQLLDKDQALYGSCHNVYQTVIQGKYQAMIRADAVFVADKGEGSELILRKGESGLEVDMTACDDESKAMFDQPIEYIEGPAGRALKKVIR